MDTNMNMDSDKDTNLRMYKGIDMVMDKEMAMDIVCKFWAFGVDEATICLGFKEIIWQQVF